MVISFSVLPQTSIPVPPSQFLSHLNAACTSLCLTFLFKEIFFLSKFKRQLYSILYVESFTCHKEKIPVKIKAVKKLLSPAWMLLLEGPNPRSISWFFSENGAEPCESAQFAVRKSQRGLGGNHLLPVIQCYLLQHIPPKNLRTNICTHPTPE